MTTSKGSKNSGRSLIRRFVIVVVVAALVLLAPLVAMWFGDAVNWSLIDFVVAGALLLGGGFTVAALASVKGRIIYRVIVGAVIVAVLALVWAELAVGVFGTPWAGS